MVHGLIFAAGLGTRLKPLTDTMPKALVPLAGKSLLQWQVEKLRDAGIEDIIVNVHHFPDMIVDAIRANNGWGCNIIVSDEREQLLDTGGGLRKALKERLLPDNEPVLACNVDVLSNIDIPALVDAYHHSSLSRGEGEVSRISQLVVSDRQTQRYLLFDEKDLLRGWTNIATGEYKPIANSRLEAMKRLAFSGMQVLSPEVLKRLAQREEQNFSLIPFYLDIMQEVPLQAYIPSDYKMMDVGKIDRIAEAEAFAESLQ